MMFAVGQRWRYTEKGWDFLVEVLAIAPLKAKIIQSNDWSTSQGYRVDRESSGGCWGLSNTRYHGDVWLYLEGQDKPV